MNSDMKMSDRTRKAAIAFFSLLGSGVFIVGLAGSPDSSNRYYLFSIPLSVLLFLSAIWVTYGKPNPYVRYVLQISGSSLCALFSYRYISYIFPRFSVYIGAFMIIAFVYAHTLPAWNFSAAIFIHDELYAPQTRIGKVVYRAFLYMAPLAAAGGTLLTGMMRWGNATLNTAIHFFMGIICFYVAYAIPFIRWSQSSKNYHHPLQDILNRDSQDKKRRQLEQPVKKKRVSNAKKTGTQ